MDPDLTLDIDEDGQVHAQAPALRRRLAAAAGHWRLIPSVRDLLVLQRVPESAGEPRPGGGVALCGEIDGPGALANVMNFVHFNQWDGALSVVSGATRKTLYFKSGSLLAARSNLPEHRLGGLLVRAGLIEEDDLTRAVREVSPQRKLGTVLVDQGLLKASDLYAGVRRQAEEIFYAALLLKEGDFYFVKSLDEGALPARLHLDTQSLLLEGLRRIDELGYFRGKIPGGHVILVRRPDRAPPEDLGDDPQKLLALVDDRKTLAELARLSHLGEFAATKAAFELLQRGLVELREASEISRRALPTGNLPLEAVHTIVDVYSGVFAKLYGAMSAKGKAQGLRQGVSAFLSGSARYASLFKGLELDNAGRLPEDILVENLKALPEGERLALLQSGLHDLLFFVLFVAGDVIDRSEERELHQRIARALEKLPAAAQAAG